MKRWGKALILVSAVLLTAGITMCNVGIQYEISQIPPEQRAQMTDTDWVGAEWGIRAVFLELVGLLLGLAGVALLIIQRWQCKRAINTSTTA
jgi:hypothetical protein